jgi:hypothetical protein
LVLEKNPVLRTKEVWQLVLDFLVFGQIQVNKEGAIELLDKIIENLNLNYSTLTIDYKLRLNSTFNPNYALENNIKFAK